MSNALLTREADPYFLPSQAPDLTLLVPAYNEATRPAAQSDGQAGDPIRRMLEAYQTAFGNYFDHEANWRIAVIDDGSTDGTDDLARSMGADVIYHPDRQNHGKGRALTVGMLSVLSQLDAPGHQIGFTDADGSYRPETLLGLHEAVLNGADIAVAKRDKHESLGRMAAHYTFKAWSDLNARTGVSDPQAGAKVFSQAAAEVTWPHVAFDGWAVDTQVLNLARRAGLKTVELPATITPDKNSRIQGLTGIKQATSAFVDLVRIGHFNRRLMAKV